MMARVNRKGNAGMVLVANGDGPQACDSFTTLSLSSPKCRGVISSISSFLVFFTVQSIYVWEGGGGDDIKPPAVLRQGWRGVRYTEKGGGGYWVCASMWVCACAGECLDRVASATAKRGQQGASLSDSRHLFII